MLRLNSKAQHYGADPRVLALGQDNIQGPRQHGYSETLSRVTEMQKQIFILTINKTNCAYGYSGCQKPRNSGV